MRRFGFVMLAAVMAVVAAAGLAPASGAPTAPSTPAASRAPAAQPWQPPQVVKIQGGEKWMVLSPLYGTSFSDEHGGTAVLVRDGELLNNGIPYYRSDGASLVMKIDESWAALDGRTVALPADERGLKWLDDAKPEDITSVRFVRLAANSGDVPQAALEKLAKANPRVGLEIRGLDVGRVLALFQPRWLTINEAPQDEKGRKAIQAAGPIEQLALGRCSEADLSFLAGMKDVRSLLLSRWDAAKNGALRGPKGMATLVFFAPEMKDLSEVAEVPYLQELAVVACKDLADLGGLAKHKTLKTLVLTMSGDKDKVMDLAPLKELKELKWLGLPPATTQAQLEQVVKDHPDLVILELAGCDKITDLAPLKGLAKLEAAIIATSATDLTPLRAMKQLKLVGIAREKKDEGGKTQQAIAPEQVDSLKKALPDAAVVTITPICLGSGWILLLAAAVAAGYFVVRRRTKTRNAERGTRNANISD